METSTQIEQFSRATAIAARSNHHYKIHSYTELRQQIHDDLRIQYPEWVELNDKSPMCDFYEARLMELLDADAKG